MVDIGPGRGHTRRRAGGGRHGGGYHGTAPRSITGQYLSGRKKDQGAGTAPRGQRPFASRSKAPRRTICRDVDVEIPLGVHDMRHRRISGSGKSSPGQRDPLQTPGRGPQRRAHQAGRAQVDRCLAWNMWTRSSASTSRPSGAPRARTRPPIPVCSPISATLFATDARTPRCAATRPGRFSLQCQGRPLRGLRGRRHYQDRNALSAGYLCALRGVQGSRATTVKRWR